MSSQPAALPSTKTLYVICHGALATLQTERNLIVMIPDMGSTHSYRAGSWLTETTLEKGSMHTLENVTGGTATVSNLVDVAPRLNTAARPPFATFVLPRPIAVHSLFEVSIAKSAFSSEKGAVLPAADVVVPLVPIFEYTFTTPPRLGSIWPVSTDDSSWLLNDPTTLHIFAEDEIPLDDGHFISAFNRTCKLLNVNIRLAKGNSQEILTPADLGTVPHGLEKRHFELEPLSHRRIAITTLASAKESGSALSDPWGSLPTELSDLGDLFFGQQPGTSKPVIAPTPITQSNGGAVKPAGINPAVITPHWKVPACAHVILGDVGLSNASATP